MPRPTPVPMKGKTVVVTGANSGIGLETARTLATWGATVVMTARNPAKGDDAVRAVRQSAGHERVRLAVADFASLDAVRALADELLASCDRLDVLVNNAGLMLDDRSVTGDGYETTLQVNHLAPYLLTRMLRDRLVETAQAHGEARVVNVASDAHRAGGPLDFDDLMHARAGAYKGFRVYGRTKLANILFTRALATRLADTGVTATSLHPGVVRTGFAMDGDTGPLFRLAWKAMGPFMKNAERGAYTTVHLASSPELTGNSGGYYASMKRKTPRRFALDGVAAERLWAVSASLCGLEP